MAPRQAEDTGPQGFSIRVCRILAGLEAGFFGSVVVLAWYCVQSRMAGEQWWSKLNVAAGLFYGGGVYSMGVGRATLAGASLLVVLYGLAGALFGLLAPRGGVVRAGLLAMAYGVVLAFAADQWLWRRLDPFAGAFYHLQVVVAGHLLYAVVLGSFPAFFRTVARAFGDSEWAGGPVAEVAPAPAAEIAEEEKAAPPPAESTPHIVESETDRLE